MLATLVVFLVSLLALTNAASSVSKIHELFVKHYPGGKEALNQALHERADWSPLPNFENLATTKNRERDTVWGVGWARFDSMGPVIQCPKDILEVFGTDDEEKRICGAIKDDDCVVISLGSNNQWEFEEAVIKHHPQCKIHTFDCYVRGLNVPEAIRSQVTGHKYCIGTTDHTTPQGNEYLTWRSIVQKIGLTKSPTAMKMDIEGGEWMTIPAIIKSGLHVPESFTFELHYETEIKDLKWAFRPRTDPEIGLFMELLFNLGYVLVDRHDNPHCRHCTEIVVSKLLPNTRFPHHFRSDSYAVGNSTRARPN